MHMWRATESALILSVPAQDELSRQFGNGSTIDVGGEVDSRDLVLETKQVCVIVFNP